VARKTKKQQKQFEEGIKALLGLSAICSYLITKSIPFTIGIIFLVISSIIGITVYQNTREKEKLRRSGIKDIDTMDGIQFEYYLRELFLSQGYQVEVTKSVGDFGADLILKKSDKKIVVQAKRYSQNVGIKAVQEVVAAKNFYKATDAWVVSNSEFTKASIELAEKTNVLLIDRTKLIESILKMNPSAVPNANVIKNKVEAKKIVCSKCGSFMVVRTGPKGTFYGCNNFPKCRNIKQIS
jgi:restriction system protein